MKTTATFTSTIEPSLIAWLDRRARQSKRTRRAVLEEAIVRYKRDMVQEALKKGFARTAHDADILELAEWGMHDYAGMLGHE